jgi:FkbM family methyltransferase
MRASSLPGVSIRRRILNRVVYGIGPRTKGRPRLAKPLLALPRLVPGHRRRSTVYRSFSWPISGFAQSELTVSMAGRMKMIVDTRDVIGRVIAVSGIWEPNVTEAFKTRLLSGDVCVDVGANAGYYSLLASRLVGPSGRVWSLEPAPAIHRRLLRNLIANRATNVVALAVAAGERDGEALLWEGPETNSGLTSLIAPDRDSTGAGSRSRREPVPVRVRSVCSIVPPEELQRVRLVKIDVEGYEGEVLRGLGPLIECCGPLTIVVELTLERRVGDARDEIELLRAEHGFRVQRLHNEYALEDFFPAELADPVDVDKLPLERCDLLLTRP